MEEPTDDLSRCLDEIGVPHIRRHIFLCADQTKPKCCDADRGLAAWGYLKARLRELGLSEHGGIFRTKANCLRVCRQGPIAVVYPDDAPVPSVELAEGFVVSDDDARRHRW